MRQLDGITNSTNGHELEHVSGDDEGQGERLACCCPWGCKKLDTTEQLYQKQHQQFVYEV